MVFEISIFTTDELHSRVGYQAVNRAKTYIEGAFRNSEHSANVNAMQRQVWAPQEQERGSFRDTQCYGTVDYSNLTEWWRDNIYCNEGESQDCDLLLTAHDGEAGRAIGDQFAVSEGGTHIADLPSDYWLWGCARRFDSMQTALHEVAHTLMNDGAAAEHDSGYTYVHQDKDKNARTPMGDPNTTNRCGNYVRSFDCNEMRWSECTESHMT